MTTLLVIHIIIVTALIGSILVQRSSTDGFTGAGGGDSFMTGRASANLLTRTTAILATLFIINSLLLAYLSSNSSREGSLIDSITGSEEEIEIDTTNDTEPIIPIAE